MQSDNVLTPELCAQRLERFHHRIHLRERLAGFGLGLAALGLILLLGGCAQNTEQPNTQASNQDAAQQSVTIPQTTQMQEQLAPKRQFVQINVNPLGRFVGDEDGYTDCDDTDKALARAVGGAPPADDHRAWHVTVGDISITEGGSQTPTIGGTTTGTSTGSQTADQNPNQSPKQDATQDIKPEIGISVALAFAPGGVIEQMAAALGGKGQLSDLDQQSQADLKSAFLDGIKSNNYAEFLELFKRLFEIPDPAGAPPGGETTPPQTPQE